MNHADSSALSAAKKSLRSELRSTIGQLSQPKVRAMSERITDRLMKSDVWQRADTVLAYRAMPQEVQTDALCLAAIEQHKTLALPRVTTEGLRFHRIDRWPFPCERSSYGIDEPLETAPRVDLPAVLPKAESLSGLLVITPGLAFDPAGGRLGQGAGYYDRFFASLSAFTGWTAIGVAFGLQIVELVPRGSLDVNVQHVVTELKTIDCRSFRG